MQQRCNSNVLAMELYIFLALTHSCHLITNQNTLVYFILSRKGNLIYCPQNVCHFVQRPVLLAIFLSQVDANFILIKSVPGNQIATNCCTCQDSIAVMSCTKSCRYHMTGFWMRRNWIHHQNWNAMTKNCKMFPKPQCPKEQMKVFYHFSLSTSQFLLQWQYMTALIQCCLPYIHGLLPSMNHTVGGREFHLHSHPVPQDHQVWTLYNALQYKSAKGAG